jgi:uncharacterized membrane protein YccC
MWLNRKKDPVAMPAYLTLGKVSNAHLRFALRMTLAGLVTYGLSQVLHLPQSLWAVLTALIVMQASVGAALKATFERMTGSIGGAVWGGAMAAVLPHATPVSEAVAFVLAVAPLAVLAAVKPAYRVAPVTAAILILNTRLSASGPLVSAVERVIEVGLGSVIALLVSLTVFPIRGHNVLAQAAASVLDRMARLMDALGASEFQPMQSDALLSLHGDLRKALAEAEAAADAAERERANYLTDAPDPEPICRTLRRLRHDLVMLGRAEETALPSEIIALLEEPTRRLWITLADFARASALALNQSGPAPSLAAVDAALSSFEQAIAVMRSARLAQGLPTETVGRIFSLAFAFGQLRQNLQDLSDRVAELGRTGARAL